LDDPDDGAAGAVGSLPRRRRTCRCHPFGSEKDFDPLRERVSFDRSAAVLIIIIVFFFCLVAVVAEARCNGFIVESSEGGDCRRGAGWPFDGVPLARTPPGVLPAAAEAASTRHRKGVHLPSFYWYSSFVDYDF
jgi:hypothetical protein